MGIWSFIQPTATINYVVNPSFERNITDGWNNYATGAAAGTRLQSSTTQKFGAYSLNLNKTGGVAADDWGMQTNTLITSTLNARYVASAWVYLGTAGQTFYLRLAKAAGVGVAQQVEATWTSIGAWAHLETDALTANATGDNITVYVYIEGTPPQGAYVDAVQMEVRSTVTTYCGGDQPGCEWLGPEHNSISQRSAVSRAGGLVVDFADRDFDIEGMIGPGMSPITLNVDSYAILPGGELNSQKTNVRPFTLTGWVRGTSLSDLHAKRQQLIEDVAPNSVPNNQPVVLRYTGAFVTKEISAYYEAGLEGRIRADFPCLEQAFALRFLAADPNFYKLGESAAILDTNDFTANRQIVAARLVNTGQWNILGPPNAAGTYNRIDAVVVDQDRLVYYGGDFQNFDNLGGAANYIISYTPSTATWATVGVGLNNIVRGFCLAPNNDLFVFGDFTLAGGVANADKIARWDGAAWNAVGNPNLPGLGNPIYAGAFDPSVDSAPVNLYVVGGFLNLAAIPAADYVAMWDGAAWNAVGAPSTAPAVVVAIYDVAVDSQGNVYVGGQFTSLAGVAGIDYIAMWDGTNWNQVVQLNNLVGSIVIDAQDNVYFGGSFTNAGGVANADGIAMWDGQSIRALGTGISGGAVTDLAFGPDGVLYAVGNFTTAGGITVDDGAKWTGSNWAPLDANGGGYITRIVADQADPVIRRNYNLWAGYSSTTAQFQYAGDVTITNLGTENAYPRIEIFRITETSTNRVYTLRNETTGKEILISGYQPLAGEIITIDLAPGAKSVHSNFWGAIQQIVLPNSDFGTWALRPGTNLITFFVDIGGVAEEQVTMVWRDPYWSAD